MNSFEIAEVLNEYGIEVPDRCMGCGHLGEIVSRLSIARDNTNYLIASTDAEVLRANARVQLTAQLREDYPEATDEQIASTVDNSVRNFDNSKQYTAFLMQAGALLEEEGQIIQTAVEDTKTLLTSCPPEGCEIS